MSGIRDDRLRERLLREAELNLENCVNICRAAEASKKQAKELQNDTSEVCENLDSVNCQGRSKYPHQDRKATDSNMKQRSCPRCGSKIGHFRNSCPAFTASCFKC